MNKPPSIRAEGILEQPRRLHFVGIGGIGMSGLSTHLAKTGHVVSGTDAVASDQFHRVAATGIMVREGHDAANLDADAEVIVASAAIDEDNPEIVEARGRGLPVVRYADAVAALTSGRESVAVAGTHGKTTTTAMLTVALRQAGLDPGCIVGGNVPQLAHGNMRVGSGRPFVVEACEYRASFHAFSPRHAIITNVGADHVEWYGSQDRLRSAFRQFASSVAPEGLLVTTAALARDLDLRGAAQCRILGLGAKRRDVRVQIDDEGFCLRFPDGRQGSRIKLKIPGRHNIINAAMAAVSAEVAFGADPEAIKAALEEFRGVSRRFEYRLDTDHAVVIDDYAHHPTEIEATLLAARGLFPGRRIIAVFQPHLAARTRRHFCAFLNTLAFADEVILLSDCQVPGRDENAVDSAEELHRAFRDLGQRALHAADHGECLDLHGILSRPGDVTIVMGAGDVGVVSHELARRLG